MISPRMVFSLGRLDPLALLARMIHEKYRDRGAEGTKGAKRSGSRKLGQKVIVIFKRERSRRSHGNGCSPLGAHRPYAGGLCAFKRMTNLWCP